MLKKLVIRFVLIITLFLIFLPLILSKDNGDIIMTVEDAKQLDLSIYREGYGLALQQLRKKISGQGEFGSAIDERLPDTKRVQKMYKWQDEKGDWHYSDKAPEGYVVEELIIDINQNVLSFEPQKKKEIK